jgi:alpha-galactosidase
MWHESEPVEAAALQVLSVLFSVPQISVRLEKLPPAHQKMLKFWLGFWRKHRDVLLDGELTPWHPESNYPLVAARNRRKGILVFYQGLAGRPEGGLQKEFLIVNATKQGGVVLILEKNAGKRRLTTFDCTGRKISSQRLKLGAGAHLLPVPRSGMGILEAVK